MTNQYGQLVLSQEDGREGINRQNNKHCFVLNGIKDGMVKIHYIGTDAHKIYLTVFSAHPIMCGGKQYGIVAFCRVPIDRIQFFPEDEIKIKEAIANAN